MGELLPCPFCGADADFYGAGRVELPHVECSECDTRVGYSETEAGAIAAWNTRADDARIKELLEAVDALLRAWDSCKMDTYRPVNDAVKKIRAVRDAMKGRGEGERG